MPLGTAPVCMGLMHARCATGRNRPRAGGLSGAAKRRQRRLAVLRRDPALLAGVAQALEARDLALALAAGRVVGGQRADELGDAVAQLQREVRGRGAHQLAHVLDGDLVVGSGALGVLGLAHWVVATGEISRRVSRWAWTAAEMACSSPISQP